MPTADFISPLLIALWGPPGSGKTSLRRAIPLALRKFSHPSLQLVVNKLDPNTDPGTKLVELSPSSVNDMECWEVTREPKQDNKKDGSGINKQGHSLEIYDPSGASTIQSVMYKKASLVICILDPTRLVEYSSVKLNKKPSSLQVRSSVKENEIDLSIFVKQSIFFRNSQESFSAVSFSEPQSGITQKEYAEQVKKFLISLGNSGQRVAVCITKRDQLQSYDLRVGPQALVTELFGEEMKQVLFFHRGLDIRYYAVSAIGDARNSIGDVPDSEDLWRPVNVEKPIIELLEVREIGRIKSKPIFGNENLKKYIRYFSESNR